MKKTKLRLLWLLALPAVPALPGRALALDTGTTYDVYVRIDHATRWMGTWRFSPRATQVSGVCRYRVEWTSAATLPVSAELTVDEQQTPSHASCAENARVSFSTILSLAPGLPAMGFDRFDQSVSLRNLTLLEDRYRAFLGTLQAESGIPYAITAQPASGAHHPSGDLWNSAAAGAEEPR